MKKISIIIRSFIGFFLFPVMGNAQTSTPGGSMSKQQHFSGSGNPVALFRFDGNSNDAQATVEGTVGGKVAFVKGLDGKALSVKPGSATGFLTLDSRRLPLVSEKNFTVQFWIKTTMDQKKTSAILSQKEFYDNSLASQKNAGWVFYTYGGTWAWNMGSGKRRITHERDNGKHQPLNDGKWHQLTMTYNAERAEIHLFYDGNVKALYHVSDSVGFDFTTTNPVVAGWTGPGISSLPQIEKGAELLQELTDAFNSLGVGKVDPAQFVDMIVDPKKLFEAKRDEMKRLKGTDSAAFLATVKHADLAPVTKARAELMKNPYTVHQIKEFMELAPLLKIYSLVDGKVVINRNTANAFLESEKLHHPDFDMDNLAIWDRALSPEEVLNSYAKYFKPVVPVLKSNLPAITLGNWNIWHGGKHFTIEKDGWDSRIRIAEILKKENADVIMMQETYSSGDFIAAELGYYFATTVDWDYLNQGANISVLSRYPITELYIPKGAPFMNVAAKIAISKTQEIYVMSNWYGMQQFPAVFDFHQARFQQSDSIPVLFGGDFNAVPHTDGGNSPASRKLLESGFTDAYRSLYPDEKKYPGLSHNSGRRIDQVYYKGRGLKNTSTKVVDNWPSGFPSDHYLILSTFDLNYSTVK